MSLAEIIRTEDIRLVVFDMAGTTVRDEGSVREAFGMVYRETELLNGYGSEQDVLDFADQTMGQSKIAVFRVLTSSEGDAIAANDHFENAYARLVLAGGVTALPDAERAFELLRVAGITIVLTTGFSRATQDLLVQTLGWSELIDLALCPADAGRGRPYPDLNLTAVIKTQTEDVKQMMVVGDTTSDVLSGLRAGAGLVVGVESGAHSAQLLRASGAHWVCESITEFLQLEQVSAKR